MSRDVVDEIPADSEVLDFEAARDEETTSWERAASADSDDVDVHLGDRPDTFVVDFADSDHAHNVSLVEERGSDRWAGWCSCKAFDYHLEEQGPCAHLCRIRQMAVMNEHLVPLVEDLDVEEPDVPIVEHADQDDVDEPDQDDADGERADQAEPATPETRSVPTTPDPGSIDDAGEFVEEISGVPKAFVVTMGGKPYVRKEGLLYLAHELNLTVRSEPVSPSWEEPRDVAAYKGVVEDDEGRRWVGHGTAHAEAVENTVGKENLDELAATRATNRALRSATGCGFASIEELTAEAAIDEPPDQETVATDGGLPTFNVELADREQMLVGMYNAMTWLSDYYDAEQARIEQRSGDRAAIVLEFRLPEVDDAG